jgi:hypothetical protein
MAGIAGRRPAALLDQGPERAGIEAIGDVGGIHRLSGTTTLAMIA